MTYVSKVIGGSLWWCLRRRVIAYPPLQGVGWGGTPSGGSLRSAQLHLERGVGSKIDKHNCTSMHRFHYAFDDVVFCLVLVCVYGRASRCFLACVTGASSRERAGSSAV